MDQILKKLLSDFTKSNELRKLKLALKFGFKTADEYHKYLLGQTTATVEEKKAPLLDMVVAFDTTGSMGAYIAAVRKHAAQVVTDMISQNPGLMIKVVAFGDYCDMATPTDFGTAYQESQLTNNVKELVKFIEEASNTSGGDTDEFYELVIRKISNETPWREGSKRSVLLIGDCEPHRKGYTYGNRAYNIDWKEEALYAIKNYGIQFDTLRINPHVKWYEELSNLSSGVCLNFANSEKFSQVMEAASYARGGTATREKYFAGASAAMDSGDEELIGVYKSYLSKLED